MRRKTGFSRERSRRRAVTRDLKASIAVESG